MPFLLSPLCHLTACWQPLAAPLSAYSFSTYSGQNPKKFLNNLGRNLCYVTLRSRKRESGLQATKNSSTLCLGFIGVSAKIYTFKIILTYIIVYVWNKDFFFFYFSTSEIQSYVLIHIFRSSEHDISIYLLVLQRSNIYARVSDTYNLCMSKNWSCFVFPLICTV